MTIDRRKFLARAGFAGGGAAAAVAGALESARTGAAPEAARGLDTWEGVRAQFSVSPGHIHLAGMLLASHPSPVREAIEAHRRGLDENPVDYLHEKADACEERVRAAAARYLSARAEDIALTDSTTMGLATLYAGLGLREGQEILTTEHDHYSTHESLRLRARRTGAKVRTVPLYKELRTVSEAEIVESVVRAVRPETRAVAVTWVHSSTGLKLPVRRIADALARAGAGRGEDERVLLCVDGVHGLGVEDVTADSLGCDFFVAGCHKWLFGPRGTGIIYGTPRAWHAAAPVIPSFTGFEERDARGAYMSPGGFHSFEHRWALDEAFKFHLGVGKARVAARVHELARQAKEGLSKMAHVKLYTPLSDELSAGIVCFDVRGMKPEAVVERLRQRRIIASVTPYAKRYARFAPGLLNTPAEVDAALAAVRALA